MREVRHLGEEAGAQRTFMEDTMEGKAVGGNGAKAGVLGSPILIETVPRLEFDISNCQQTAWQILIDTRTGFPAKPPHNARPHVTRSASFPSAYTLLPTLCFSNRKPEILESLLSPLKSIKRLTLIANFEPNSAPSFSAAQIKKNAEIFPRHAEAA